MRMNADAPRWALVSGHRVYACVDCRALPEWPADDAGMNLDVEYRPKTPRPAPHGGPQSARCDSHWRAFRKRKRARAKETYQTRTYGLGPELLAEIESEQLGLCPCGASLETATATTDHDHDLAEVHEHPEDKGCPECVRGRLCSACNRQTIGYLSWGGRRGSVEIAAALRALAAYLDDPPAQRVLRRMRADVA